MQRRGRKGSRVNASRLSGSLNEGRWFAARGGVPPPAARDLSGKAPKLWVPVWSRLTVGNWTIEFYAKCLNYNTFSSLKPVWLPETDVHQRVDVGNLRYRRRFVRGNQIVSRPAPRWWLERSPRTMWYCDALKRSCGNRLMDDALEFPFFNHSVSRNASRDATVHSGDAHTSAAPAVPEQI